MYNKKGQENISKTEKTILSLFLIYFIYIFMYGMIIKVTIVNDFLFEIKSYIPELILTIICFLTIIRGKLRLNKYSVALLFYLFIIFIINVFLYGLTLQGLYLIRDLYLPTVTFILVSNINFSEKTKKTFFDRFIILCKIFLIIGLILVIIEQIKGWKWTSAFYTGYEFYGQDSYSKVKIAHALGLLRSPSLTGNYATFGTYCLVSEIVINARISERWKRLFWDIVSVVSMVLATNKSCIVAFFCVVLMTRTISIRKQSVLKRRMILLAFIGILVVSTILIYGVSYENGGFLGSMFIRGERWRDALADTSLVETIIPYKQFLYGSGGESFTSIWDNVYFYFAFTIGIFGMYLLTRILIKGYPRFQFIDETSLFKQEYIYGLFIGLLVIGLTTNITQGRGFLAVFYILLSINYKNIDSCYKTKRVKKRLTWRME